MSPSVTALNLLSLVLGFPGLSVLQDRESIQGNPGDERHSSV